MDQIHSYKYNKDYNGIQQFRKSLLMKNLEQPQSPHRVKKSSNFDRQQSISQLQTLNNIDQLKDASNGFVNNSQINNAEIDAKTSQMQSQLNQNTSKQIHQKRFLPFIQERDSIGRLISKSTLLGRGDGSYSDKLRHESYKYLLKKSINEEINKSPKQKENKQQIVLQVNELIQKKNVSISQPQSSNNLQEQSPVNFQKGFTINQDKIKGYCNVIDKISPLSKQIATKRGSLQKADAIDISVSTASKQTLNKQQNTHKRHSSELNLASMIFRNLSVNNNSQKTYLQHLQNSYQQQNYERKPQKQQMENEFSTNEITQIQDKSQADQKSLNPLFEINNLSLLSDIKNNLKEKKNNILICQSLDRQDKSYQNTSKSIIKLQNSDNGQSTINLNMFKFIQVNPKMHAKKHTIDPKQKAKQQTNMHSNYFFNGNKQPSQNNMHQFQKENEESFSELLKGVKVSKQQFDRFVKNELNYYGIIQKNDEEKIVNFQEENVTKFISDIQILKNRARKLKKNINQMSENAMNNLNQIDSQYNYKYSIPIEF
ncbi:hypothetical protein ABPG74_015975 [Tetrahymena malaccensis]